MSAPYRPLDKTRDEIRLLRVHDLGPGETEDIPIKCSLEYVPLRVSQALSIPNANHPGFVALSYTWGDLEDTVEIWLDECPIHVTRNLAVFLQHLRRASLPDCLFWIDALSINQQDVVERSHQVQRMIDIYCSACSVFLWLGPESDDSGLAIHTINQLYADIVSHPNYNDTHFIWTYDSFQEETWISLCNLLDRPYWSRIWIHQELAVRNAEDVTIICGRHSLDMTRLKTVFHDLMWLLDDWPLSEAGVEEAVWKVRIPELLLKRMPLMQLIEGTASGISKDRFRTLLYAMENAEATDPRDRVYGLLGLQDDSIRRNIVPNYSRSTSQIYTDFVKAVNIAKQDFTLIYECSGDPWRATWPSWVPDFRGARADSTRALDDDGFRASGESRACVRFSERNTRPILSCHGFLIDEIDGHGRCTSSNENDVCQATAQLLYQTQTDMRSALQRILIKMIFDGRQRLEQSFVRLSELSEDEIMHPNSGPAQGFYTRNGDLRLNGIPLRGWFSRPDEDDIARRLPIEQHAVWRHQTDLKSVTSALWGRNIATTVAGRIGTVPRRTRKGDCLVIILGCRVPLVLRPDLESSSFRLIGPGYVDGLMAGEAMQDSDYHSKLQILSIY